MRNLSSTILLLLFSSTLFSIGIEEAYKKGFIQYEMKGTEKGNSGDCIAINITNTSETIVNLEIETGRVFEAEDTNYQNMIVTKRFFARLNPKQKTAQKIYALCAEPSDATPNNSVIFKHGKMATGTLQNMAKFVETKNLQDASGQSLIWSVINNITTYRECDYQPVLYASLKTHFASDKNVSFIKCPTPETTVPITVTRTVRRYKGSFGFSLPQSSDVEISLFDKDGKKVKQLDFKKQMSADWYDYEYEFTDTNLNKGETYELRLIINGRPKRVMYIDN
jgi:hypothetical protein